MAQWTNHFHNLSDEEIRSQWLGPYPINKIILHSTYWLKLPLSFSQTHPVFSVTLLRPYNVDTIAEWIQHDPPPPVVQDRIKEYKVECLLESQIFRGKLEYLIRWKGYGIEEDEWRPSKDVKGVKRLISEFHRQNPKSPKHLSAIDFSNLPFHPITNFTDTPDIVPSD